MSPHINSRRRISWFLLINFAFVLPIFFLWLLVDDVQQACFEGFLVLAQPILLPGVVEDLHVKVVALHASFKETNARLIVRFLLKSECSAVVHEFFELGRITSAQVFERQFNFLLLDCSVLFILRPAGQSLPG